MVPEPVAKEINIQLHDFTFQSFSCVLIGSEGSGQRDGNKAFKGSKNTGTQERGTSSHEESQYCSGKKQRVSVANAVNPSSSNWVDGTKQKQVNRVLEVFKMSGLGGKAKGSDPVDGLF